MKVSVLIFLLSLSCATSSGHVTQTGNSINHFHVVFGQGGNEGSKGQRGASVDLSGTYSGTVNTPDLNLSGPGTFTITGNSFTLDVGGAQQTGTITARQVHGQIYATLRFGTTLPAQIITVRVTRRGTGELWLKSVFGESHSFSFSSFAGPLPPDPPSHKPCSPKLHRHCGKKKR